MLTQSFCGNCGSDLTKSTKKTRQKFEGWLADAINLAKQDDFEEAVGLLARLGKSEDFRYRDLVENARQAIDKVKKIAEQRRAQASAAAQAARDAIVEEDHQKVFDTLKDSPHKLLPESTLQAFHRSKSFLESQDSLESELKAAMGEKDWFLSGSLLHQMTELEPDNKSYRKLAEKVGRRLMSGAKTSFEARRYPMAIRHLDAIPSIAHDEDYGSFRSHIENVVWLRGQFEDEPLDTPILGRLAVRLRQDEPGDPRNEKRVQKIATNLKQGQRPERCQYPVRAGLATSWIGGDLGFLSALTFTERPDLPELRGRWGQMNVAFGLALQGVGAARIKSQLAPQKGLLGRLTKKKVSVAYGMDIGSHSIKVVGLQKIEEKKGDGRIEMIDGFVYPFEQPVCRPGFDEDPLTVAATAIEKISETHHFGDAPIWINLPSSELISRFTLLPPVADKQANQLLDSEITERIPLELDALYVDRWMAPYDSESTIGRPAVLSAIKNRTIEQRLERLRLTDLNIVGMQSDPVALVNLVSHEFAEELDEELEDDSKTPTIAIVDCGAETTSTILVSRNSHWIWTNEFGGEDLTGLLARELKRNRSESEELKYNPHNLPSPASNYSSLETRMDEWRSRLQNWLKKRRSRIRASK